MPIINQVVAGGGTTPTGTITITNNGTYDVTDKATADVQVPTTAPAHYIEKSVDANGKLIGGSNIISFNGVTDIGNYQLTYQYYGNTAISGPLDMSSITTISGTDCLRYAFYGCTGITSVDLSSLTSVTGDGAIAWGFQNCTGITSIDLSALTSVTSANAFGSVFKGCTGITGKLDLSSLTNVTQGSAFQSAFEGCTGITSVDLSSLTSVSGSYTFKGCFKNCTGITTVTMSPTLTDLSGGSSGLQRFNECFMGCTSLANIDLSFVKTMDINSGFSSCFEGCIALTSVDLSSLESVGNSTCTNMFKNCTGITTMKFSSLKNMTLTQGLLLMFNGCTSLQSLWFYALGTSSFGSQTTQFNNMLSGVTGCTVHFPMAIQSTIGSWASVTGGFGGTNTTVLFDLVTSLTGADSNTYTRQEKDSTSTATAWVYNDTLYYTSGVSDNTNGVNDPTVGTTIYSDAACTTSVTTVSAIA